MNDCHMSVGLKNVCRTWRLPGASRKTATSAASTTSVLAVEIAVARRPPPDSSRGPRPAVPNEPGGCQLPPVVLAEASVKPVKGPAGGSGWLSSMGAGPGLADSPHQGLISGTLR